MTASKRCFPEPPSHTNPELRRAVRRRLSLSNQENVSGSDTNATSDTSAVVSSVADVPRPPTPDTEYAESANESSEISSSSEDPSSESEEDDNMVSEGESVHDKTASEEPITVPGKPRLVMRLGRDEMERGKNLRERLKDFLPQIAAANEELERERSAGTLGARNMEDVDEEAQEEFIEMNLGLGVLEEKSANAPEQETSSDISDTDDGGDPLCARERDIMGKLMGHKRDGTGIQVLEG